jgi:hypothetical protein
MNVLFDTQCKALKALFTALKIRYAVIGGVAVLLYGEPRLTLDIDVSVSIAKVDIKNFLAAAEKLGFRAIPGDIMGFISKTGVIPLRYSKGKSIGRADIIIAQNAIEHKTIERAVIKKVGSVNMRVVSAEDLIIHKITSSRPRDRGDLAGIIKRQKDKLDLGYIRHWLRKIDRVNTGPRLIGVFNNLIKSCRT